MPPRDSRDLTQELSKLKYSVTSWRRRAPRPRTIPKEIWDQAVVAAEEYGVGAVARHVGLDHAKLKLKLAQRESPSKSASAGPATGLAVSPQELSASFFELLAPPALPPTERCIIEVESSRGVRMRLEFPGLEVAGLVTLVREFVS